MSNKYPKSLDMESLYARYQRLTQRLPKRLRALALVLAPAGTSLVVLISGLVTVAAGLAITAGIGQITAGKLDVTAVVVLLLLAFVAESVGYIVKERQEFLLTAIVQHLTYHRFRDLFTKSAVAPAARGHVLTYPGQISQFAYVVDSVVSVVQITAFLVISFTMYGLAGVIAALLITALVFISVQLIKLIGNLWEKYIDLEGERRSLIQKAANALPRAQYIPSWANVINKILATRHAEETTLRKRVRLQVLNGFIDRSALTVLLAVVAIIGVLIFPNTSFGIGIILATRYLYAAVQNLLVNYRIIRLAKPMMRELDALETAQESTPELGDLPQLPTAATEVIVGADPRAAALREAMPALGAAFVPRDPQITQTVLAAWTECASAAELARFTMLATQMGLPKAVSDRFWQDATSLSSGERHRAAVALVLAENPDWLILDDTFAALDPETRELAAQVIRANVTHCTLLASSEEYIPAVFADTATAPAQQPQADSTEQISVTADTCTTQELPDPAPKQATFLRAVSLLFGKHTVLIALGALLLAGAEVGFALMVAKNDTLTTQTAYAAGACALAALLGTLLFFAPIYQVPIARLSKLHKQIMQRLQQIANPQLSGAVVGRLGEDFSELQMSVPGALGSVFFIIVQTLMLITAAVAGAPLFIIVVLAVAPLALLAMRLGSKRIMPASTAAANQRGEFLGAVGAQAGLHTAPVSAGLGRAGNLAYATSERAYLTATTSQANAYAFRSVLIQTLILLLNSAAVVLVAVFGNTNSLVTPAAVIFFAVTLAAGIQSTVETLQEVGVLGLTAERVRLLADFQLESTHPVAAAHQFAQLQNALDSGSALIALIGRSGAGKSVMLDTLCRKLPAAETALIPEADPFAKESTAASGLVLAHTAVRDGSARLILLDETLKTLSPQQERAELELLGAELAAAGKQAVVVLHSRTNLDCFDAVVSLD